MKPLRETLKTKVPPKKVWRMWADTYNMNKTDRASSKQKGFKEGRVGHVRDGKGRKAKYRITKLVQGKSFTMVWGSIALRMYFTYSVSPDGRGSNVSCKVKFGGLFVFPLCFFLRGKVRKNLADSLHQFVQRLEMQQQRPQMKMVRR